MAIYPIIKGQKPSEQNFIPPRASASKPSTAEAPAAEAPAPDNGGGDLIDFGQDDAPAPVPAENPAVAAQAAKKDNMHSSEIRHMLEDTGKPAPDGPLIDFAKDLKKDLPPAKADLKRSETGDSNDVFFDVES